MSAPQNYVSVSRRPPDVEDYIEMLRRYRSWVIGPAFAGLVCSVVLAFFWPNMYVCSAAMQIKPSSVSNNLLPVTNRGEMQQRLAQLDLEILGRDNLITLIKKQNLYEKEVKRLTVEDVAEFNFRKHVHLQPYEMSGNNGAQAFKIWFEYPDRVKARALVLELMNEFTDKNIVVQTENTKNQSGLVEELVSHAKDKLTKAQGNLSDFTAQNQGKLPENFEANMMAVTSLQAEISQTNDRIGQEQQSQAILESSLSNNKSQQTAAEQSLTTTQNIPNQEVKNHNLERIQGQIDAQQAKCKVLEGQYQDDYPAVQSCHEELASLRDSKSNIQQQVEEQTPQPGGATRLVPNLQAAQALAQLQNDERIIRGRIQSSVTAVGNLTKKGLQQERLLKEAQDKINASPQIIQQYNALLQEVQISKDDYAKASAQETNSQTLKSMQEHQAVDQLEVLENPILPENPTSPQRGVWITIGTVLGIVLGVALAGGKEVKDTSLKNLKDVRAYTNLPVLSSIPLLENALLVRRKRRLAWLAWSSAVIVGSVLMSGAVYYYYFLSNQVS